MLDHCLGCGDELPRRTAGRARSWCSDRCRARYKRRSAQSGSVADLVHSLDSVARRLDGLAREVDVLVGSAAVASPITFERT